MTDWQERWSGLEDSLKLLRTATNAAVHAIVIQGADRLAPATRALLLAVLDRAELTRCNRLRQAGNQHRFITSRALLRLVAAVACGSSPRSIEFAYPTGSGMPPRLAGDGCTGTRLSLSRSTEFAACAVCRSGQVGIDIENRGRFSNAAPLVRICLDKQEASQLAALPESARDSRFLSYWTAKEAALKAYGSGLVVSPKNAHVELDSSNLPVAVTIDERHQCRRYPTRGYDAFAGSAAVVAIVHSDQAPLTLSYAQVDELARVIAGF